MYGARTPISHVGSINIEDAKTLRISPWDKSAVSSIEKAINEANLGVSVASDSEGLRVHFPALTEETRLKMVKILKDKLEDARVKVRNTREEGNKEIDAKGKALEYGEDDQRRYKSDLQNIIDKANESLQEIFSKKELEILG